MTHTELNKVFSKIEKQRADLFQRMKGYDEKILNQCPDENVWSVMEVVEHLIIAEDSGNQYLKKKTQDKGAAQKVGLKESFRSLILNAYLRSNKKFKAPATTLPSHTYRSLAGAETAWRKVRADFSEILQGLPEGHLDKNWFKHPVAGKLSLKQMMTFIEAHVAHHEKQIERTLKAMVK